MGEAAATIAEALGADSHGIELNEARAEAAHAKLDHVLATSAFSVRLANGAETPAPPGVATAAHDSVADSLAPLATHVDGAPLRW